MLSDCVEGTSVEMSKLVLRNRARFRRRSKPSFWNASVPPFDQAVKRLLGRVGGWTWVACVPLTLVDFGNLGSSRPGSR